MDSTSRRATTCRLCGSADLEVFLDLGAQPAADAFTVDRGPELIWPLQVQACNRCGWSQLTVVVKPEILYQRDYPYEASTTAAGRAHFAALAESAVERFSVAPGRLAVDIGCNDGVLLAGLQNAGMRPWGIDPAENITALAKERGFSVVTDFFGVDAVRTLLAQAHEQAALVTATNVFAHVDDLDGFMAGIDLLLAPDGVLIIEAPYFNDLVQNGEYDTIYHEHLSYLTLSPLVPFFAKHGFTLFDAEQTGIHGGSVRLFVQRADGKHQPKFLPPINPAARYYHGQGGIVVEPSAEFLGWLPKTELERLMLTEADNHIHTRDRRVRFTAEVALNRKALRALMLGLCTDGAKIAGISAPAKGMTLINSTGIGEYLEFLTEKSGQKVGKYAPGSRLPVLTDGALTERGITHGLVLAWNFADEIIHNQRAFREAGGQFITPIPRPQILDADFMAARRAILERQGAIA